MVLNDNLLKLIIVPNTVEPKLFYSTEIKIFEEFYNFQQIENETKSNYCKSWTAIIENFKSSYHGLLSQERNHSSNLHYLIFFSTYNSKLIP